jgi:hypothetical protein
LSAWRTPDLLSAPKLAGEAPNRHPNPASKVPVPLDRSAAVR